MDKASITIVIDIDKEELSLIWAAVVHYRIAGFPLGRSSFGNPISQRDRREFAALGMKVFDKLQAIRQGLTGTAGGEKG